MLRTTPGEKQVTDLSTQPVGQRHSIDRSYDSNALPVQFPRFPSRVTGYEEYRRVVLDAVKQLIDQLLRYTGHRFWHAQSSSGENLSLLHYSYYCCQDDDHPATRSDSRGQRDREQMERYKCQSRLTVSYNRVSQLVKLHFSHSMHPPYEDTRLTSEIKQFIDDRIFRSTPAEIVRDARDSSLPGSDTVARHQVYYRWVQANASVWRRDADPSESARLLLEDINTSHRILYSGNVRGIAIYIPALIHRLSHSMELVMDETYGTNNAGQGVFAVLAEYDGAGNPLAYLLVDIYRPDTRGEMTAESGSIIGLLSQFISELKNASLQPLFFHVDKDPAEAAAVQTVLGDRTLIRLCYWHMKRAVRARLMDSKRTATQQQYHPQDAKEVIPSLEICWGSQSTRRPQKSTEMESANVHPGQWNSHRLTA